MWVVNVSAEGQHPPRATRTTSKPEDELNNLDIRYDGWRSATGFNWQRLFGARGVGLLGVTHSRGARSASASRTWRADGVPPTGPDGRRHRREPDGVLRGLARGRDHAQVRPHAVRAVRRQDPGGRQLQDLPHRLRGDLALRQRQPVLTGAWGRTRSSWTRSFRAYQTGAYVQATEDDDEPRLNVTAGLRASTTTTISARRASARALGADGTAAPTRCRGARATAATIQQPFFLFLSAFPENRGRGAVARRSLRDRLAWAPSHRPARRRVEVYRKKYRDYPVAAQFPSVSLANVGDTFDVREILFPLTSAGRGERLRRRAVRREAADVEDLRPDQPGVLADAARRRSTASCGRGRSTTRSSSTSRAATA